LNTAILQTWFWTRWWAFGLADCSVWFDS